jgi:DNA replication protein DnaC
LIERRIAADLPERFRKARLGDFPKETGRLASRWLAKPTDGLFIAGLVGAGKTHLAAAILRDRAERRIGVIFRRCADFFRDLRETYRANCSEETVLEPLDRVCFLILDDLGAGSLSDHERRFALELLDRRLNAIRPTIVTSNWNLEQIAERMDDRIASRLSSFTAIELAGEDRRLRGAASCGP